MVVVAIIGILASVAIPQYETYTIRAQMTEALTLSQWTKKAITDFHTDRGIFPADNSAAGVPEPKYLIGNYTTSMQVEAGAIHVTLGNKINARVTGQILTLRPIEVVGSPMSPISWICGYATPPNGMAAAGQDKTNVAKEMLPASCRS